MKRVQFLFFILFFTKIGLAQPGFNEANSLYNQAKYKEAAEIYKSLTATYPNSYQIWYNLGNASFKSGKLGLSIAAYRKALKINPLDSDAKNNLEFAFQKTVDKLEPAPKGYVVLMTDRVAACLSSGKWTFLSVLTAILALGFFLLYIFIRKYNWKRIGLSVSFFLWIISFSSLALAAHRWYYSLESEVIITAGSTQVLAEPTNNGSRLLDLKEGAILSLKGAESDWIIVRLPNGNTGYIKASDVVII